MIVTGESERASQHPHRYRGKVVRVYVEEAHGDGPHEACNQHRESGCSRAAWARQPDHTCCRRKREHYPAEADASVVRADYASWRSAALPRIYDNASKQRGGGGCDVPSLADK